MFRFVFALVEQVLNQLLQQMGVMEDILGQIMSVAPGMKEIWTGSDARACAGSITESFQPAMNKAISSTGGMHNCISRAVETVRSAEQKSTALVSDLRSTLEQIAKGLD